MDPIKEAFAKAKEDIFNLQSQLILLRQEIQELKRTLRESNRQLSRQTDTTTHLSTENPAIRHINTAENDKITTNQDNPAYIPTDNYPFKALKSQNIDISTRNSRVSTDSQTDRQSDSSTGNKGVKVRFNQEIQDNQTIISKPEKQNQITKLQKVSEIVSSLDDIKKSLRMQLKKLTNQEMAVFSAIYQLEEEGFTVDYPLLAKKLALTESSIRDYIQRALKKGIPIQKTKENNKKIILSISSDLKKIASLNVLFNLREL